MKKCAVWPRYSVAQSPLYWGARVSKRSNTLEDQSYSRSSTECFQLCPP